MSSEDERFHEFFTNRPVIFVFYVIYTIVISVIGIYGNSMLIFMKMRKFRYLNGFEVVVITFATALIVHIFTLWIVVGEEIWPELSKYMCSFNPFVRSFALIFMAISINLLVVVAKFPSKVKIHVALVSLVITFTVAIIYAYPYFELTASALHRKDDDFRRYICVYSNPNENVGAIDVHHKITTIVNFILCPTLLSIFVIASALWRNSLTNDKEIWIYSIVVGLYFIITDSPLMINALTSSFYRVELSRTSEEIFQCLVNFIVALNPVLYGTIVDRYFLNETMRIVKIPWNRRSSRRIQYISPNDT